MPEPDKFECWSCGACCRFAGFKDPALDRGDKACIHLIENNQCTIYEDRPDFCRLNPDRDPREQTKWCKLTEKNWKRDVTKLKETFSSLWGRDILPRD